MIPVENDVSLSVVIRIIGGKAFIRQCLRHLMPQVDGRPIEIIVPYDATVAEVGQLQDEFPRVRFLDMGTVWSKDDRRVPAETHELYDCRAARGLTESSGEILAMLEDLCMPAPDWCSQIIEAHRSPHGAIGGAVEHTGSGGLNWAVYFQDFGRYQLPLSEGPADHLTDINVSYKRKVLHSVREVWSRRYNEVAVHSALIRQGVVLWRCPRIVVYQDRGKLSLKCLAAERYSWGRLFGSTRVAELSCLKRMIYVFGSPAIPAVLVARQIRNVLGKQSRLGVFMRCFPFLVVLTATWSFGEFLGYLTRRESSD